MDKKEKLLLAMSVSAIILSGCTTSNTDGGGAYRVGQSAQDSGLDGGNVNTGVTHTHNGVAHTHRLPEGGLKHSHNIGTGNNRVCQPCGTQNNTVRQPTANTGGNCHTHAGRRHCHALPTTGTNHQHNTGAGPAPTNNTYVNTTPLPPVNPQPLPQQPPANNSTYYDYTNTGSAGTGTGNTSYYDPAPTSKGSIPHAHNGSYHSHALPAAGLNHNHTGATGFGSSGSSSVYNGGSGSGGSYNAGGAPYSGSNNPPSPPYNSGGGNYNNPVSASSGSCNTASGNYHIVQAKEGVYRIGVNNGVKRDDIIRLNNLQMPDYTIQPGQCLRLR